MAWVPIPDLGQGLNLDGSPAELAPGIVTDGRNMRFRAGFAERFKGMGTVFTTPLVTPYHICHYTVAGLRYVVYAGTQKTYVDDGTTQTDITNANNTGAVDDRWCGFVFNGVYVQNNGVDIPQYWGGNTAVKLANLPGWPVGYKAGWMRAFGNKLVAGDITRGGVRERGTVLWSHTADPGTLPTSWDIADATKDAGDVSLADSNGTLTDALPLGDMNVIYKDDALYFQQNLQSNLIFRHGRLPGDTGLIGRGCVAQVPGAHVYLAPNFDVLTHSGQGPQSILDGRMRKWLAANMSSAVPYRSFVVNNPATSEALVCFPKGSATTCNTALVWNYKDNTFAVRDLANVTYGSVGQVSIASLYTWGGLSGTWNTLPVTSWADFGGISSAPRLVFAGTAPRLSMYESTEQDNGASFEARIDLKGLHLDSPDTVKLCRGVRPRIDAPAGTVVQVQLGASMTAGADPTWQSPVAFTVGTDITAHGFATGRYLAVRFYTTGDSAWRIRSCELDVVPQGGF